MSRYSELANRMDTIAEAFSCTVRSASHECKKAAAALRELEQALEGAAMAASAKPQEFVNWLWNMVDIDRAKRDRIAELQAQLQEWRDGFQGACYACEPVGEKNVALRARVAELEAELDRLKRELRAANKGAERNIKVAVAVTRTNMELKDENERLRELLRPAAAFADVLDSDEIFEEMREPETIIATLDDAVLTAADCYAARAALEGKG